LLPVLQAATAVQGQPRPRIWWCPTGPLTFLPLHAAGRHTPEGDCVLDQFISSYVPSLRLLLRARDQAGQPSVTGKPLIVALPDTPGLPPLFNAATEADDFASRFSGASQLRGANATVEAVRSALRQSPPLAHFACHGAQDVTDPSAGRLFLHDGPLGIADIAALQLDTAELAYLSACETSVGNIQLSDEAITLATAFRLAGYRHVIGTLWSISDTHAPNIARRVYQELHHPRPRDIDASRTAAALDSAILALRNLRRNDAWLWASYIHIGP
jgi:CHAT domain-containing protein